MNSHGPFLSLDTRYKLEGHTVLYIPAEALNMKPEVVFKDKELVQRLESEWLAFFHESGISEERKGGSPGAEKRIGLGGLCRRQREGHIREQCKEMERFRILSCSLHDPLDPADKGGT